MTNTLTARPRRTRWLAVVAALLLLLAALVAWLNVAAEEPLEPAGAPVNATGALIERGAYLARAGNCMGCHTTAGGAEFAGGRGIETPFGRVFASNITPDATTGIGSWSAAEFWRAMHHGRSRDGRLLYPAFPYPSFTSVTREDSDALHAYLRSVAPVQQENKPHALAFPFNTQAALVVWRALFFRPEEFVAQQNQTAQWNRGRYLVQGLGHCAACHSTRNVMGGTGLNAEFAGGLMPDGAWYAPSLASPGEAGVQGWSREQVVKLLKDGASAHATASGPMAEVVSSSTQHLADEDLDAMAEYLGSLPVREGGPKGGARASAEVLARGGKLYEQHCASCHGANGEGAPSIYPALAGNRAVVLDAHHNLVQVIRNGGFAPSTAGNPQPFGMPPFVQVLGDDDIAAVTTFVRQSWGNSASAVSPFDVYRIK
ncbi:c-type cytochrome [Ramlibacter sp. Leaf400]|uniref:c-type cytochrome n=1 Tax=Ramlibacter sp. Leaf400 TaxID=1736365 RepID=UPI0006F3E0FE|nr:cytochrome c [Ramlibacter sp. Leaf400]KQT11427.1 alcohol dehydrogenase [Ramlibacter sp. Leaf400]